jgi:N utilization substance protein B
MAKRFKKKRPSKRTLAREAAMKLLYLCDLRKGVSEAEEQELLQASCPPEDARGYARILVDGVRDKQPALDSLIGDLTPNWDLKRIAAVERNIIRVGSYEILHCSEDIPVAVAIDEAVSLAKRFGSEKSGAFVNGVLDAIHRTANSNVSPKKNHETIEAPPGNGEETLP